MKAKYLNADQKRTLASRIATVGRSLSCRPTPEPPAAVVKARQVIDAWEAKQDAQYEKDRAAINKDTDYAREKLYFGTPEEALQAVKDLEAKYGV